MDGRIALTPGVVLKLNTGTGFVPYTVDHEVGRGGSCIVYDASYTDNAGNYKLVRIKECYPHAMHLSRDENGRIIPDARDAESFSLAKERFREAYQKNHELFMASGLMNTVANTSNIHEANDTVYIVTVYMNGRTFADYQGETLHDCVSLVISVAKALRRIHEAGYLYLDLKPDNILTIEGSMDLVQLFDFDSMISMEDLKTAIQKDDLSSVRTSYTKGYAPLEQQTGKLKQLGKHSDIFSLGAVLFFALWHKSPSAFDCAPAAEYDYNQMMSYAEKNYQDTLFPALTEFFHKTLASYYVDRYQEAFEAIDQLNHIRNLADETKPWLFSTPIQKGEAFYGREKEMAVLSDLLHQAGRNTASLYGMGGIGKSTMVREYLTGHTHEWDAILWLYDHGNLAESIADDMQVRINTIHRFEDESTDEYLKRKLKMLKLLAAEQKILLVLDNFDDDHLDQLEIIRRVGWTILLISRERMPEGMFPSLRVEELPQNDLAQMFQFYAHCDLSDEGNMTAFQTIVSCINGHTLLTELIARQISKSYLDLQVAEAMVAGIGLTDLPTEKIDYIHDQSVYHGTLLKILDRLVEIDQFTEQEKVYMKLLSMFDTPGIDSGLFRNLSGLDTLGFVNELETLGWVKVHQKQFCLHPMMREYIHTWAWSESSCFAADQMMRNLYELIRPVGTRHDGSKQFPSDYGKLYPLLYTAEQMINHSEQTTEASQRLLFRLLMDAPVDQDASVLFRMLDLLKNPKYLDDDSVLRLYENAAYFRARLYSPEDALKILGEMKRYLIRHPSAYYLSAYHRAMAVILHNADEYGNLKKCLKHEDKAIAAARVSKHADAPKQLASSMLDKATTLLSADIDREQARELIAEAKPLIERYTKPTDYERYQYVCIAAMCSAMDHDHESAEVLLEEADSIAFGAKDSDLSVAEHLIEEVAPIRMAMEKYDRAAEAVLQAIKLCDRHEEAIRYRETRFDAYQFLGRIYAMNDEFIKAESAFAEAEKYVDYSPYEWKLPLCPDDIREKAEDERRQQK